jgi:hypothetical protein
VENEIARKVYIKTDLTDGYNTSVLSGIKENDAVILNPPEELSDGMIIKVTN